MRANDLVEVQLFLNLDLILVIYRYYFRNIVGASEPAGYVAYGGVFTVCSVQLLNFSFALSLFPYIGSLYTRKYDRPWG